MAGGRVEGSRSGSETEGVRGIGACDREVVWTTAGL
jgi:hypothetical protein